MYSLRMIWVILKRNRLKQSSQSSISVDFFFVSPPTNNSILRFFLPTTSMGSSASNFLLLFPSVCFRDFLIRRTGLDFFCTVICGFLDFDCLFFC
eukprot:UN26518